jgi:regulator of protease activity HflC (stomatin/prohibitin superfamily)
MKLSDGLPSTTEDEEENNVRSCSKPCGSPYKRMAWGLGITILLLSIITLLSVSLKKLGDTQYGLEYNVHKKTLDDAAKTGGLHLGPPGYKFIKFPSTFITVDVDDTCVSRDGLRVKVSVGFQYQMPYEWLVPAVIKFRNYEKWSQVVAAAGRSAVHHSCSYFNISNFQNQRGIIQGSMLDNLRIKLEGNATSDDGRSGTFARAISLQLKNVDLPDEYEAAVQEKQSAEEDIALAKNQREQEITKANTMLFIAKETAQKILDTAVNDANVTLTEARLKAEETTYAFQSEAEVLVSVKKMLNLTTDGVLAFMSNQLYQEATNLKVSAAEPARLSRKDEL